MSKRPRSPRPGARAEKLALQQAVTDTYTEAPPDRLDDLKRDMYRLKDGELYRAPSAIAGAGLGLFSRVALKRGQLITWYEGAVVNTTEYGTLKKRDPDDYRAYTAELSGGLKVVGNYRRGHQGALVKIDDLATFYAGKGAFQFMNGGRLGDTEVNVGQVVVKEARRLKLRENPLLLDLIDQEKELQRLYPDSTMLVAVALADIPANHELIMSYGDHYMTFLEYGYESCIQCSNPAAFHCKWCQTMFYCSLECQHAQGTHTREECRGGGKKAREHIL